MKSKKLLLAISILSIAACTSQQSSRLDDYVKEVESSSQNWTEEEWEMSLEQYDKLLEEYQRNYDSYTPAERDSINQAIGRYNGLIIKREINEAGSVLKEFGERLPSLIEGFMSAFDAED